MCYNLDKTHIGRKNGDPVNDIVLGLKKLILAGMGIKKNHAVISNVNGKSFIEPFTVYNIKNRLTANSNLI